MRSSSGQNASIGAAAHPRDRRAHGYHHAMNKPRPPRPPHARPAPRPAARPSARPAKPAADWRSRLRRYWKLVRGDRPIGWLLLLWPTWWALWLAAEGFPPFGILLIFTAGVWLMRSAGCIVNDYADRWLDPHVARTRERPLATGEVAPGEALLLFAVLALVAFGLVLLTNRLTVYLSFVGIALAASYPYLKRYTWFPQVYLGAAFGWAIPMAFAAVTGEVPPLAWLAFLATVLWATAYDTWYAMVDREDDIRMGARSTAILFGDMDLVAQGVLFGSFLVALVMLGQRAALGWPYLAGLGIAAVLILWQFWLARRRTPEGCFRAFLNNHWVGMAVFAGIAAAYAID
jgi:4-hydroxybenzoate polyprenyltransferase